MSKWRRRHRITSFLTNRNQQVVIDGECSTKVPVTSSVPQGSVLGPTLFLLFINDLLDHVKSEIRLFAEDCLIYRHIYSLADSIAMQQASMQHWPIGQRLGHAVDKKKCYVISTLKGSHSYFYQLNRHVLKKSFSWGPQG